MIIGSWMELSLSKVHDIIVTVYLEFFTIMNLFTVMQYVMFNSVPMDLVIPIKGLNSKEDRVKMLLKYLRKFGIPEEYIFTESDLFEFKNIPKVTRCIAMLAKMVRIRKIVLIQCIHLISHWKTVT